MLFARQIFKLFSNVCVNPCRNYQVTIVGCGSEIGQTTSLLLRSIPSVTRLVLHDTVEHLPGIVLDLSHIPSNSKMQGYTGDESLEEALQGSNFVIATGGVSQKSGWITKSALSTNADFIKKIAAKVVRISPLPFFGIVTEPINVLVPIAAEIMRSRGCHNQKKLLGITTIDTLKAQCLYGKENGFSPSDCFVPVIGGHSKETKVPLISQAHPKSNLPENKNQEVIATLRNYNIFEEASNIHSPVLSVAYSVSLFTQSILETLNGHTTQINAYVENNDFGTSFFSGLIDVNQNGVGEMQRYSNLSEYECLLLDQSIGQLRKDVALSKKILELA